MNRSNSLLLSLLLAAAAVISCEKDNADTFSYAVDVKVSLPAGQTWSVADRVVAFCGQGGVKAYSGAPASTGTGDATFRFNTAPAGQTPRYVLSNCTADAKVFDGAENKCGNIVACIPAVQNPGSGFGVPGAGVVKADSKPLCAELKPFASRFDFTLTQADKYVSVSIGSKEGIDVAGTVNIPETSIGTDSIVCNVAFGSHSITAGVTSNGTFHVYALPSIEFTPVITFTDTAGCVSVDTLDQIVTMIGAGSYDFGVIDAELEFVAPARPALNEWEQSVLRRADLINNISWTPSRPLAKSKPDQSFSAGEPQTGMVYSSVWSKGEPSGFVGYTVSFRTFLSALNNPQSRIYDIDYHNIGGTTNTGHAGCMYGSVCSTTVMYMLGYPVGYTTSQICSNYVPALENLGTDFSDLRRFDIACYNDETTGNGHTLMIYDLKKDAQGQVTEVTVQEAWMPLSRRKTTSLSSFLSRMQTEGDYHHFRVNTDEFCYTQPAFVEQSYDFAQDFPDEVCLNDGDFKTYQYNDTLRIKVDILSDRYSQMVIEKDGTPLVTRPLTGRKQETLFRLPVGEYRVWLSDGVRTSRPTCFEVVGTISMSAFVRDGAIVLSAPKQYQIISVVPVSSGNRTILTTGKGKDGRWVFPLPEGSGSYGSTVNVRVASKYGLFTYGSKVTYK